MLILALYFVLSVACAGVYFRWIDREFEAPAEAGREGLAAVDTERRWPWHHPIQQRMPAAALPFALVRGGITGAVAPRRAGN